MSLWPWRVSHKICSKTFSTGQSYLVDSQSASGIRSSMLTSDAEMMMNSTELFVQPQLNEQSQNKSPALEPQLSGSETSAQRSSISDADEEEARLEGLVSGVSTNERMTPRHSKSLSLGHEHVDRMTATSPETPAKHQEEKQDCSHQSNPTAQISFSEEMVFSSEYYGLRLRLSRFYLNSQSGWGRKDLKVIFSNPSALVGAHRAGPCLSGSYKSPRVMTANSLPYVQMEPPMFQSVPVAFSPGTGHHWKECGSVCLTPCLQTPVWIVGICPKPSHQGWTVPSLSAFPSRRFASGPLVVVSLCWTLHCVHFCFVLRPQKWAL